MGINFPNSPTVGTLHPQPAVPGTPVYRWDGEKWTVTGVPGSGTASVIVSDSAPTGVPDNSLWWDSSAGLLWILYNDGDSTQWVLAAPVPDLGTTYLRYDQPQVLTAAQQQQARSNIYAAPFDAMAYSGLQINGAMEVSQERGTNLTTSGFVCDVWNTSTSAGIGVNWQQVLNGPPGFGASMHATVATAKASLAAADQVIFYQALEGYRTARLAFGTANAQPVTLGFWTSHHRTGMYSGALLNPAQNRTYPFSYTQNVADAWEYKNVVIPGDITGTWPGAVNTAGMYLIFAVALGSTSSGGTANVWQAGGFYGVPGTTNSVATTSDVFRITGVIVLPGTQAPTAAQSPLIMRPYDQELQLCKRYWQLVMPETRASAIGASSFFGSSYSFQPEMRVTPTTAMVAAGISANASNYTFVGLSPKEGRTSLTSAASGDCYVLTRTYSCDARL